jgi:glycine cleavage system aminomethyltransferase T
MLREFYESERIPLNEAFGVEYPEYFFHPIAEYHALVRSCGVIDLTHWRVFSADGRDSGDVLGSMLADDVASLQSGQGCHSMMTTAEGKVLAEVLVLARKTERLVVVSQGDFGNTLAVLKRKIADDVATFDDMSAEYGILGVEGPQAKTVMNRLLGTGPLPGSVFAFVEREFEGFRVVVVRNSATGESGFHVIVPSREVLRIRNYLVQAARGSDGLPIGRLAWDIRRMENGIPWYGVDFSGENSPREVRLRPTMSDSKDRRRGKEPRAREHAKEHVTGQLVGLVAEASGPSEHVWLGVDAAIADVIDRLLNTDDVGRRLLNTELSARAAHDAEDLDLRARFPIHSPLYSLEREGKIDRRSTPEPVGFITSAVYSLALRTPLFIGYVRHEGLERNRGFLVDTPGGSVHLRVIDLPVVPGQGSRCTGADTNE